MKLGTNLLDWNPELEKLIGAVRLALATGSLVVVWIDPTQPSKHATVAYIAFTLYLVYSFIAFQLVRTRPRPWLPLTTQLIDLLWIPPVLLFTEAGNTPYFPFFVVIMLTAGIRWGLWASWAVTIYSLMVYAVLLLVEPPTPLDLNNDVMQLSYFLIVGILGGHLAEYRRKREAELKTLRATTELIGTKYTACAAMEAIVDTIRDTRLAEPVVGVMRDPADGEFLVIRGANEVKRLSADEAASFFSAAAADRPRKGARGIQLTEQNSVILRFADAERGLVYPVHAGEDVVGAIFLFFRRSRLGLRSSVEFPNLLLSHVIPQLETLYVLEQAPQAKVLEERRRIARDLHDSFIQVLAALGLRLDVMCAAEAPARLHNDLVQLREIIAQEHKRVRAYVKEMREPLSSTEGLRELIDNVVDAFRVRTRLPVEVTVSADASQLPREIVRELAPLLREALTNVEKHARATRVRVTAGLNGSELVLVIRDDGIGIRSAAPHAVAAPGDGLPSMRERTELLGGRLTVTSGEPRGTAITVSIPLPALV